MKCDPPTNHHHRRSIRLSGYDYAQSGAYFMTICTHNRQYLFGDIADGEMQLNDAGRMVERCWNDIPTHFPHVELDAFVVMPNHVHFIVVNMGHGEHTVQGEHAGSPLHVVLQWFKTMTTNEYICGVKQHGWSPFCGKLWQRNYWEHIVRNAQELNHIREYIRDNPASWQQDSLFLQNP
jgi:putative transposase